MKILVLLKQTPDTEAKINISGDGKALDFSSAKFIANPYDDFAVEQALLLKEQMGNTPEVVIVSFANADAKERILKGMAMGADRGVLVGNDGLEDCDSLAAAKVLTTVCQKEGAEVVFCGKQGIDADNMHTGVMVAEMLGWPHVNVVTKMEKSGNGFVVNREIEGGQSEVYKVELPAVFGTHKSLNTPRYASLPGIMKAKKKPFEQKSVEDLGLSKDMLKALSKTQAVSYALPKVKAKGKLFKDRPVGDMVKEVVKLLREEAKVL